MDHSKIFAIIITAAVAGFTPRLMASPSQSTEAINGQTSEMSWAKVGQTKLRFLFWDIYSAELYTPTGLFSHQDTLQPLSLKLTYWRDIDKGQIIDETRKQFKKMSVYNETAEQWLANLAVAMPDIRKGDSLTLNVHHNLEAHLLFNDEFITPLEDQKYVKHFSDIWLSSNSDYPKLTQELTGAK